MEGSFPPRGRVHPRKSIADSRAGLEWVCMASSASPNFVHLHLHTDYLFWTALRNWRTDGRSGATRHACGCGDGPRQSFRRRKLLSSSHHARSKTHHRIRSVRGAGQPQSWRGGGAVDHFVLLCENDEGYRNLIKLVSTGFLDGFYYKPRVDHELLARHGKGLIALSACLCGEVADALLTEKYERARINAYRLRDIFGKGIFSSGAGPGIRGGDANQPRSGRSFARNRHPAGSNERLPLPDAIRFSCAGSADVHPDGQDHERRPADEVRDRSILFQDGGGDGASLSGASRRGITHRCDCGPLQRENPARQQPVSGVQGPRGPYDRFVF